MALVSLQRHSETSYRDENPTSRRDPQPRLNRRSCRGAIPVLALGCASLALAQSPARPNIVLILADDLGYGDPRCYNPESRIQTPNLDGLASRGIRFTDAHSPSAVCTPTRYGLLTGRYAWRTSLKSGVLMGYAPMLVEPGRMTVASLLRHHGYATAIIGKWHLGFGNDKRVDYAGPLLPGPRTVGFDYFFGIPGALDMEPYVYVEDDHVTEQPTATIEESAMRRYGGAGFWRGGSIAPSFKHADVLPRTADRAVSFIRDQTVSKPFFLYFALTAPHTPWLPAKDFEGRSGAGYYGDFVSQVDAVVGRVLDAIEEKGLAGNTLVLFTSDNGAHWLPEDVAKYGHRANGVLRGQKADVWEGGHRVPFIARWPGRIREGSRSAELICLTDLLATTAAILGTKLPEGAGEDSYNILPALQGKRPQRPIREAIVHHSSDGTFGIRQGSWKLILGLGSHGFSEPKTIEAKPGEPEGQLYDLERDPQEQVNRWSSHREVVARLTALLERYQRDGRSRRP